MTICSRVLAALVLVVAAVSPVLATDLRIETGVVERAAGSSIVNVPAVVNWKNSWRNGKNHDAVWLFAKAQLQANGGWRHARVQSITVADAAASRMTCTVPADRVGAFCVPSAPHRGDIGGSVVLTVDLGTLRENERELPHLAVHVLGVEMVYVPDGAFSVGNPDPRSAERAAFYRSTADGTFGGPFRIESEAPIDVAPRDGALYYQTRYPEYEGDRNGPVPAAFPKGTRAFYAMKYEITQGEYAAFLNHISATNTFFRAPFAGVGYYEERGTIRLDGRLYAANDPDRPANWISWDDGTAFADWAGLRPMTELEYTKAARGPVEPSGIDYPWGATTKEGLLRRLSGDGDLVRDEGADESRLTDDTRHVLGASYYWVMDLAGSVWERVVSAGHPKGRAFLGSHGDGTLGLHGFATNGDWPSGDHNGGGYGYKGGGYYEMSREMPRIAVDEPLSLNPHSPIDWRNFAAWGAAPRSLAYGFRAVRTAEPAR